jgi:exonuclease V gamma subunit
MGLNIQYVPHLAASLDPVAEFLQSSIDGADLFQREYVIVPTAGVKAWLMPELVLDLGLAMESRRISKSVMSEC